MEDVVIGDKVWGHYDYDITLWCDRGKGRAQIVQHRRRAVSKDQQSHNALHIARIVIGTHLVGFLIHEAYHSARFIPFVMLADTKRGNSWLGEDGDGRTRWLCTKMGEVVEEMLPKWIKQMRKSKKMVDLNELRYFGKYGINYDINELIGENSMFDETNFTHVSQTAEEDDVDMVQGNCKEE